MTNISETSVGPAMTEGRGRWAKAPWTVGPVDDTMVTHIGYDGQRYEIAYITGDYNSPDEWPIMEANARLIAAAPDMAEVLIGLCSVNVCTTNANVPDDAIVPIDVTMGELRAARAALAKARGA